MRLQKKLRKNHDSSSGVGRDSFRNCTRTDSLGVGRWRFEKKNEKKLLPTDSLLQEKWERIGVSY